MVKAGSDCIKLSSREVKTLDPDFMDEVIKLSSSKVEEGSLSSLIISGRLSPSCSINSITSGSLKRLSNCRTASFLAFASFVASETFILFFIALKPSLLIGTVLREPLTTPGNIPPVTSPKNRATGLSGKYLTAVPAPNPVAVAAPNSDKPKPKGLFLACSPY